ncbi:MAG: UDP-N-acetylmuramoyl-tripeptide--D-alanyl-D-alanine ligase [Rickettsiales bacterium]|nr:UDP-N-acetylmuramoyl-tripeptide--D-alanyl-D-alanine ligase [Rickettsiales bacterium]
MSKKYIWDNNNIKKATQCELYGDCHGNKLVFDSRDVEQGSVFVALAGNNTDGHKYVQDALSKGCSAAIVNHMPDNLKAADKIIKVQDVLSAVSDMAIFNRQRSKAKIIGITGSVGKTSTKEVVRQMLEKSHNIFYTSKNFNGQIGIPVAVASMPQDVEFGIYEMGMSFSGEMTNISRVVRPDIAIITNIYAVHLENFNSIKDIARAKAEIFQGMSSDGVVFLNKDNEYTPFLLDCAKEKHITKIYTFGVSKESDGYLQSYKIQDGVAHIEANILGEVLRFSTDICGEHQAVNMVVALLLAKVLSLDVNEAIKNLKDLPQGKGRGRVSNLKVDKKKIMLLDESYNASPMSMKSSLKFLDNICTNNPLIKRKIAIMGNMYELGPDSKELHRGLLEDVQSNKIDKVITVGDLMHDLFVVLPDNIKYRHYNNYNEVIAEIDTLLKDGDGWLIKGSNGTKMYEVVKYLERYAV